MFGRTLPPDRAAEVERFAAAVETGTTEAGDTSTAQLAQVARLLAPAEFGTERHRMTVKQQMLTEFRRAQSTAAAARPDAGSCDRTGDDDEMAHTVVATSGRFGEVVLADVERLGPQRVTAVLAALERSALLPADLHAR